MNKDFRKIHEIEKCNILSTIINSIDNGVIITDTEGTIVFCNDTACKISGYTKDEIIGENPRKFKSGLHPSKLYDEMWASITKNKSWHGRIINKRKNGELWEELLTITPIELNGKIEFYTAIQTDTKNIVESEKMKKEKKRELLKNIESIEKQIKNNYKTNL